MNLRDNILAAQDRRLEPVTVPEWGDVTVYVPTITVGEAERFERRDDETSGAYTGRVISYIVRDSQGNRVFTDADAPALAEKSAAAVKRVMDAFNKLNGNAGN